MSSALQLLLLMSFSCGLAHSRAVVTVSPPWLQFVRYDNFNLSCSGFASGGWQVWRYTEENPQLARCGRDWGVLESSVCHMSTALAPDSGVYWCESEHGSESSNAVLITVTNGDVTLRSPSHPVKEGDNVTLRCYSKSLPSDQTADFDKNNTPFRTEPSGHMTLQGVSTADQGPYTCRIKGGRSPPSPLHVEGDDAPVSLAVFPNFSQFFEYSDLRLNCSHSSGAATVWRFKTQEKNNVTSCGSGWGASSGASCLITWAKKPDSAIYWCQTPSLQRSNSVNIKFNNEAVILQSPAQPVTEGENVTLICRSKTPSNTTPAEFYKDDKLIRTEPSGHMTLRHVSESDEGFYRCKLGAREESLSSWLSVRGSHLPPPPPPPPPARIVRHLVVSLPYCIATILMLSVFQRKPTATGKKAQVSIATPDDAAQGEEPQYDDVTTDHHF